MVRQTADSVIPQACLKRADGNIFAILGKRDCGSGAAAEKISIILWRKLNNDGGCSERDSRIGGTIYRFVISYLHLEVNCEVPTFSPT